MIGLCSYSQILLDVLECIHSCGLNINVFISESQTPQRGKSLAAERERGQICLFVSENDSEWRTVRGKFLAINAASMSCACPRSPKGLSPAAHLANGTTDLILVRKCSRFDFLRHLLRHTSKDDQVWHRARMLNELVLQLVIVVTVINFFADFWFLISCSTSLTWPLLRCTACGVSASLHVTARATQTWSWTCRRAANGRSSARSVETTRLVVALPPTAAGTATARSWRTQLSTSGTSLWQSFILLLSTIDSGKMYFTPSPSCLPQSALPVDQAVCTRHWRASSVRGCRQPVCNIGPLLHSSLSHTGVFLFPAAVYITAVTTVMQHSSNSSCDLTGFAVKNLRVLVSKSLKHCPLKNGF